MPLLLEDGTGRLLTEDGSLILMESGDTGGVVTPPPAPIDVSALLAEIDALSATVTLPHLKTLLKDETAGLASLIGTGGGTAASTFDFSTRSAAALADIPISQTFVRTAGYLTVGDNGHALYKKVSSNPGSSPAYFQSADGAYWKLVAENELRIEQFGGRPDYVTGVVLRTDNLPALNAAMNYLNPTPDPSHFYTSGTKVLIGYGSWYFSGPIQPTRTVWIEGIGNSLQNGFQTELIFNSTVSLGIALRGFNSVDGTSAALSTVKNLYLRPEFFGGPSTQHGVDISNIMTVENVMVQGWGGNGFNVVADQLVNGTGSDANLCRLVRCWAYDCGQDGLYTFGGDANVIHIEQFNASTNGGYGIHENGFLGNTYISCHTAQNALGGYMATALNSASIFIGCYSESEVNFINVPSVVIGGNVSQSNSGNAVTINGNQISSFFLRPQSTDTSGLLARLRQGNDSIIDVTAPGSNFPLDWKWENSVKAFGWQFANLGGNFSEYLTSDQTTITCGRTAPITANNMVYPKGIFLGSPNGSSGGLGDARALMYSSAAPTTGTYAQGDRVLNNAPAAGGSEGWVCVTAGTPGTWKTFGSISA